MATTNTNGTQKPASRLSKVQKGRLRAPLRYLIYGPEGVGKTTLGASAPKPILADIEDGSSRVDVPRYLFNDGPMGHVPATYAEFLAGVDDLTVSDHDYKTFIIDTTDRLESLIWKHMLARDSVVCARNPKGEALESVIDYGYGKGYDVAVDEWRALCARLDRLRYARKMDIVLLGHAQIKTFKNPTGEDYDRYQLRINEKAAGFLKEWAEVTAFACFEDTVSKTSKWARPKGISTGTRLLRLSRTAAVDAKSRIDLPEEVEIDITNPWAPFAEAVEAGYENETTKLQAQIADEVKRIGDPELAAKVGIAVKGAVEKNDRGALSRYLHELMKRPTKEEVTNAA